MAGSSVRLTLETCVMAATGTPAACKWVIASSSLTNDVFPGSRAGGPLFAIERPQPIVEPRSSVDAQGHARHLQVGEPIGNLPGDRKAVGHDQGAHSEASSVGEELRPIGANENLTSTEGNLARP